MSEVDHTQWHYESEWMSESALRLTINQDHAVRWHSYLLIGSESALLVDPWPWPHTRYLMDRVEEYGVRDRLSDVLVQSPHPLVFSSLSFFDGQSDRVRVWCTGSFARYFPKRFGSIEVVPATGPSVGVPLGDGQAVRLIHAETETGSQILLGVDEAQGVLYAPCDWLIYTTTGFHGMHQNERPATPTAISRHFGLNGVRFTHEVVDNDHRPEEPEAISDSGDPVERCPMTNLPRGQSAEQALRDHLAEHRNRAWLFYIGVDNMESINATYGREFGDQALFAVAQALQQVEPPEAASHPGALYRYAGPTFLYLWAGELAEALELAEAMRTAVSGTAGFLETLTASIGVVAGDEVDEEEVDAEEGSERPSVEDADNRGFARLRIARNSGGDTICALSPESDGSGFSTGTVLIVDPEIERLRALTRELEAMGMSVLEAKDGLEALQVAHQIVPDVVVSEVTVPKMDGFALRQRLRQSSEFGAVPFVLISHRKSDELVREAAALGIVHYYQKPISTVELVGVLRNLAFKE